MAKPTKAKATERLQRQLDEIPALQGRKDEKPNFTKWERDTKIALANTFGEESRQIKEFNRIRYVPFIIPLGPSTPESRRADRQAFMSGLDRAAAVLESMLEEIEEYWEDEDYAAAPFQTSQTNPLIDLTKVFVVHGRDLGTMNTVARFIRDLDLEPVILQEQPDQGLTVIEKFEQHAQVGFAVVLFTPDDIGALRDGEGKPKLRARQNVIFELGYLIAKLGRSNVTVLYKGDEGAIEIPSDYAGVLYISLDSGDGWKMRLIGEMKSAGLEVDANRAFG